VTKVKKKVKVKVAVKEKKIDHRIIWMRDKIELDKFEHELWIEEYQEVAKNFLDDPAKIKIFYWVEQNGLKFSLLNPPILDDSSYDSDFFFFLKMHNTTITEDNISKSMLTGLIQTKHLFDLLTIMQNDYVLQFFNEQEWSPNVKREFTISLRLFMAKLTENAYKRRGTTKLYIPKQESDDLGNFNNDSEMQQRIDNLLTFWIN